MLAITLQHCTCKVELFTVSCRSHIAALVLHLGYNMYGVFVEMMGEMNNGADLEHEGDGEIVMEVECDIPVPDNDE